ncbi:MAG: nitroreductase family protein [Promethearchaeota archaeon]
MKFSKSIIELIRTRTSWRTYARQFLQDDLKDQLREILKKLDITSPFDESGGKFRFELVEMSDFSDKEKNNLGLSRILSGSYDFIVGNVQNGQYNRDKYGYYLENIVLKATDLGLGTCWLAGYFNRKIIR